MSYLGRDDTQVETPLRVPELKNEQKELTQYDRISAFLNTATETTYSDPQADAFAVYMKNLNSANPSYDATSGFIDSMSVEAAAQVGRGEMSTSEAAGVASAVSEDLADPELSHKLGAEIIAQGGNPQPLLADMKINKMLTDLDSENGLGGRIWEYAKSVIPGRDTLLDLELFNKLGIGGAQEKFVQNFHSLSDEAKQPLLDNILKKVESVDGYWVEKMAFLQDLTSTSSSMENQSLRQFFVMLDAAGVVGDVAAIGKIAGRSNNLSNSIANTGNTNLAGAVNSQAIQSPQVAKALGVDREMAVISTLNGPSEVVSVAKGTAQATLQATGRVYDPERVVEYQQQVRTALEDLNALKPEIFSPDELGATVDKYVKKQLKTIHGATKAKTVKPPDYEVVDVGGGEITVRINYGKGVQEQQVPIDGTAWKPLEAMAEDAFTSDGIGASPKFYLRRKDGATTINRMVEDAGIIETTKPIFQKILGDAFLEAKKMSGVFGSKRVGRALTEQDKQGKLFSPVELETNFKMTKKHMDSYYATNSLVETLGNMESYMRWRKGDLNGIKEFAYGGDMLFGKVHKGDTTGLRAGLEGAGLRKLDKVYDVTSDSMVDINYKKMKKQNKHVVILDKPQEVSGIKGKVQVMIVPKDQVKRLRPESMAIHRVGGYIPRIREDAKYFVKEDFEDIINGKPVKRQRTYAGATTKAQQQELLAKRRQEIADGKVKGVSNVIDHYDREGIAPGAGDAVGGSSGLFTGHRATHNIIWGDTAGDLMEPFQAIARNMQHVASMYPTNEWKMAMVARYRNSVKASNVKQANDEVIDLHTPIDRGTPEGNRLELVRQYVAGVTGIPDMEATKWENWTRAFSERVDKYSVNAGKMVRRSTNTDPTAALKYLAFQSMLGWFNPAQLFVQATNLATAASIHPWLTVKHMNKALALRAVIDAKKDGIVMAGAKKIAMNGDELVDIRNQFKRAGLDQIQTNADMDAALQGFGVGRQAFAKAANAGLIFYRNGELAARTVSYVVAREAYMRNNKIKSWTHLKDTDHRRIKESFDNLSLNLGRENKAAFQRGITSLPTQFWHVQTKFAEQFFGHKFTGAEKIRLAVGQAALFGTAGVPFGGYLAKQYANYIGDGESPVSQDFVDQGMMSWISSDIAIANRGGIPNQMTEQLMSIFQDDQDPLWAKMMGASGTLLSRSKYALDITSSLAGEGRDPISDTTYWEVLRGWAGMLSTFNNAEQAYWMAQTDKFISKNTGQIMFDNPTNAEIFGKAVGFQSRREQRIWEMDKSIRNMDASKKKLVDRFFQQMYTKSIDVTTVDFSGHLATQIDVFAETFSGGDEWMRQELAKAVFKKIMDGDDKETKLMKQTLKREISSVFANHAHIKYSKEEIGNR